MTWFANLLRAYLLIDLGVIFDRVFAGMIRKENMRWKMKRKKQKQNKAEKKNLKNLDTSLTSPAGRMFELHA